MVYVGVDDNEAMRSAAGLPSQRDGRQAELARGSEKEERGKSHPAVDQAHQKAGARPTSVTGVGVPHRGSVALGALIAISVLISWLVVYGLWLGTFI